MDISGQCLMKVLHTQEVIRGGQGVSAGVGDGKSFAEVALVLRIHEKTVTTWVHGFCCDGLKGAPRPKPTGRPPS
jgi:transposase